MCLSTKNKVLVQQAGQSSPQADGWYYDAIKAPLLLQQSFLCLYHHPQSHVDSGNNVNSLCNKS